MVDTFEDNGIKSRWAIIKTEMLIYEPQANLGLRFNLVKLLNF